MGRLHHDRLQRGFTLVELMIALVLGMVVVAAAGSIFMSNKRLYGSTETVGRIQENQRAAFELFARDVREAAGSPCAATSPPANMLQSGKNGFWTQFGNGLFGTEGGGTANDKVDLYMSNEGDIEITDHTNPSAVLSVTNSTGIQVDDVLLACNADVSIIFQATHLPSGEIQHNGGGATGNCGQEFQHKNPDLTKCSGASAMYGYCFVIPAGKKPGPGCHRVGQGPAVVVRMSVVRWEVKDNKRGGTSLYRSVYYTDGSGIRATPASEAEVAEGITAFQLKYQSEGSAAYQDAPVADWKKVISVQLTLTTVGADGALTGQYVRGTDGQRLTRTLTNTVALRNREATL